MTFQILGGKWKGRKLRSPSSDATRPTQGILRQAVFNICQSQIVDACFLDLFAGSGAMGLEALSRGAQKAVFVEKDRAAVRCIRENIRVLAAENCTEILSMDVLQALRDLSLLKSSFDIVYIDPPYDLDRGMVIRVIKEMEKGRLISSGATLFIEESSTAAEFSIPFSQFKNISSRRFGSTRLKQVCYV